MNNLKIALLSIALIAQSLHAGPVYTYVKKHPGIAVLGAAAVAAVVARQRATVQPNVPVKPGALAYDQRECIVGAKDYLRRDFGANQLIEYINADTTAIMGYRVKPLEGLDGGVVVVGTTYWNNYAINCKLDQHGKYIITIERVKTSMSENLSEIKHKFFADNLCTMREQGVELPTEVIEIIKTDIVPLLDTMFTTYKRLREQSTF